MAGVASSPEAIRALYEAEALAYDRQRARSLFEARWLARFAALLPKGGAVLDLGCGAGDPIAGWFMAEGFAVTGLDFAPAMLSLARARWPEGDWIEGDLRSFELGRRFDGIVAWDSFYHLKEAEQRACIARMARHLRPGGALLLTVGPRAGETTGEVAGRPVHHASLSPAAYAACLEENGLILTGFLAEDPETNQHSVLMARQTQGETP